MYSPHVAPRQGAQSGCSKDLNRFVACVLLFGPFIPMQWARREGMISLFFCWLVCRAPCDDARCEEIAAHFRIRI
jgi:hypothetical protein